MISATFHGMPSAFPTPVKRHFMFALVLTFGILPLQCATLERLSLNDMIAQSTSIVRGKVTSSYAAFSGPVIYTHYSVQVLETLKGSAAGTVDVAVPGGTVGNLRQSFGGAPGLQEGDQYVFFLWTSKSGLTQVIGLTQGLFSIGQDGGTDPTTTRKASRERMIDPATGKPVNDQTLVMRLSQLRARIGSRLGSAAK